MDFDGKVLLDESHNVDVAALTSQVYLEWPLAKLTQAGASDTSRVFVVADLHVEGSTDFLMNGRDVSRNLVYLAPTKSIHLKPASLSVEARGFICAGICTQEIRATNSNVPSSAPKYQIFITSPVLARSVYLSFGSLDVALSDNYVNILPGETFEIAATTTATLDALKAQMKVISLTDAFAPQPEASVSAH